MQPGLICPVLDYLHRKLMYSGTPPEMHEASAMKVLTSYSFYMEMKNIRSMLDLLKPELANFLLRLCASESDDIPLHDIPPEGEGMGPAALYQMGQYAIAEDGRVSFVSPLHSMVFLINHFKVPRPRVKSSVQPNLDFGKYIRRVVSLMDTDALAKSAGITPAGTPNERVYMDEFYKVGTSLLPESAVWTSLLPESAVWSPEVGYVHGVSGRVDYFCGYLGWLIEGMRDGVDKEGHLKRFREGGRYWRFFELKLVQKWAVLDFAPERIRFKEAAEGFWQIRFGEGFKTAKIKDPVGEILPVPRKGAYDMMELD